MPTCPTCGEIVMSGDPYCPHCGTIFKSSYFEEQEVCAPVEECRNNLYHSITSYHNKKYDSAFYNLILAFDDYNEMNESEKSQLSDNPFNQYWIVDLCCKIVSYKANIAMMQRILF